MSSGEIIEIENFKVCLVKSTRAKHILLKQNSKGEIVLTCPRFCPKMMAIRFAKSQIPWIRAHVQYGPKEKVFKPDEKISIVGTEYCLKQGKRTEVKDGVLFISGEEAFFHRRVCSYAQKMLLPYLQNSIYKLTKKLGIKNGRITLRNTSSRWGSCSSTHNLSFCWKIAFAPKEVIDYLIAHEVAHLVHMNHSRRFWDQVDALTNQRVFAEKWLKKNGHSLQSIK